MTHFDSSNFWLGSVCGIFFKFSSYISGSDGPSPDEGLYIFNLYHGMSVEPPMITDQMIQNYGRLERLVMDI